MKLLLYGATGMIGSRILSEALLRGHQVTAVVRDLGKVHSENPLSIFVVGDILDPQNVAKYANGQDAVINAFGPREGSNALYHDVDTSLLTGMREAGVKRLVVVGGAGSLEVAPGVQLVDTPQFPQIYKARALAQRDELNNLSTNASDLDWTFFSPAAIIHPGERTGAFRLGGNSLMADADGNSEISAEDFAIALLDELESPKHIKQRFTIGY
jgi:putative NADH-flavin reductase